MYAIYKNEIPGPFLPLQEWNSRPVHVQMVHVYRNIYGVCMYEFSQRGLFVQSKVSYCTMHLRTLIMIPSCTYMYNTADWLYWIYVFFELSIPYILNTHVFAWISIINNKHDPQKTLCQTVYAGENNPKTVDDINMKSFFWTSDS